MRVTPVGHFILLIAFCLLSSIAFSKVIYVRENAQGARKGTSWTKAYPELQLALDDSMNGDEIWVSAGTYRPTQLLLSYDSRSATFQMVNGVAIYGGFPAAGEPGMQDRDPNTYETILTGDLNGDDGTDFTNRSDNCYHVFYHPETLGLTQSAILDGFVITGGSTSVEKQSYPDHYGGGMYNRSASPQIVNCKFVENEAVRGGGICNLNSDPLIFNCIFTLNRCNYDYGEGGAMYNLESSNPTIGNSRFDNNGYNNGFNNGGGISSHDSSVSITNCQFRGNVAAVSGGGIYCLDSLLTVSNCNFEGNSIFLAGPKGGGIYCKTSTITVENCDVSNNDGLGMCVDRSITTILYCSFSGNTGGGLSNIGQPSQLQMEHCDFINNLGLGASGAAISEILNCSFIGNQGHDGGGLRSGLSANIENCTFKDNTSTGNGGGIYNPGILTIKNCIFENNESLEYGGGIYNGNDFNNGISATLTSCSFIGNKSLRGGAMCNWPGSNIIIKKCDFLSNSSTQWQGSGIYNTTCSCVIDDSVFKNNTFEGKNYGMIQSFNALTQITNCIITHNEGYGIELTQYNMEIDPSDLTITNCTIAYNTIFGVRTDDCAPLISNSIIWGNGARGLETFNSTISHCNLQEHYDGPGNISVDPGFVNDVNDFHLRPDSLCINMGSNEAVAGVDTDFEGNSRILFGKVDIGADEALEFTPAFAFLTLSNNPESAGEIEAIPTPEEGYYDIGTEITLAAIANDGYVFSHWSEGLTGEDPNASIVISEHTSITANYDYQGKTIYVNAAATGANDGTNWSNAYTDLQSAIEAAVTLDTLWVAEGTYKPSNLLVADDPQSAVFQMVNGVSIYGGFPSVGEPNWVDRNPEVYETILSGDLNGNDYSNFGNRLDNCYHVFYHPESLGLDESALLDGFIISGGSTGTSKQSWPDYMGGGMYNRSASPTIINCIFTGNEAYGGGGLCNWNSSPEISNCQYDRNRTNGGWGGGGIFNYESSNPTITHCDFTDNSAYHGGGIYNSGSSPMIDFCEFISNDASYGGALANANSDPVIENCIIANNIVGSIGGGIYNNASAPSIINCTVYGNLADYTGGMWNSSQATPTVYNSIFWANASNSYDEQIYNSTADSYAIVVFSNIQGGYSGEGNIDQDPLFSDSINRDFHLKSEYGRWDSDAQTWVTDNVTSPCIDMGDPNDASWQNELWPHGKRINMGAYGGTTQASMSTNPVGNVADLNHDNTVDLIDWSLWADDWMDERILLDSDFNRNNVVDPNDLNLFMTNWLWSAE